jgi:hypothetical protein
MRRRALTEATRELIRAELEESRRDRAEGSPHPKPEKAAAFERAITALDHGALAVAVEKAVWWVTGEPGPDHYLTVQRDRESILAELKDGHAARAGHEAAAKYADAIVAIEHGALAVFAGGMLYRVVEE